MKKRILKLFLGVIIILLVYAVAASAHCAKDTKGIVLCSQYPTGGIEKDNMGNLVCGKGECRKSSTGDIFCSKVAGGGADIDAIGNVLCLGGCEPASRDMCVKAEK